MVTQTNQSDPRVKRTRQLLLQAFLDLLKAKGFNAISVQDIADRATVNRATFYAHFEDKYALLDYFIRSTFQQALAEKIPVPFLFTIDNLHLLTVTVLEHLAQVHGQCRPTYGSVKPLLEATVQDELYNFIS